MSTKKIISLGEKFNNKYLLKYATESHDVEKDIKAYFVDKLKEMSDDNVSAQVTLGYENVVSSKFFKVLLLGANIEIKNINWNENISPELKNKYERFIQKDIIYYVNTKKGGYEGGPWTINLP